MNQMKDFDTEQVPNEQAVIKHVPKRSRKNVSVRYFHKWRKDSPCALIPSRDGDAPMNAVDREAALGGKIRICRPTDVPRFCEHVYRYENDCLGSMCQCANCLAQWKQGRWRAAMHGGPCGTLSCQRNPEADFLREQVHAGGN